ncbi:hypothetical protein IWX90DRAFT_419217 [Phyllosticta citrichinensis]|uniref:Myb-like domain-containing protein n=1 Tax=Phyllosticta citrichinensis TaxID=1130410 RepID=A0ABR1XFN1_9PEZI
MAHRSFPYDRVAVELKGTYGKQQQQQQQQRFTHTATTSQSAERPKDEDGAHAGEPIKFGKWTPVEDETMAMLYSRGFTWNDIMQQVPGRTLQAARQRYYDVRNGRSATGDASKGHHKWMQQQNELLVRRRAEGAQFKVVADELGVGVTEQMAITQHGRLMRKRLARREEEDDDDDDDDE